MSGLDRSLDDLVTQRMQQAPRGGRGGYNNKFQNGGGRGGFRGGRVGAVRASADAHTQRMQHRVQVPIARRGKPVPHHYTQVRSLVGCAFWGRALMADAWVQLREEPHALPVPAASFRVTAKLWNGQDVQGWFEWLSGMTVVGDHCALPSCPACRGGGLVGRRFRR